MVSLVRKAVDQFQDWINLILAALLFISPWVMGFTSGFSEQVSPASSGFTEQISPAASWNAWICGAVIAVLAVLALVKFAEWEEWIAAALGVWLVISPWALGFTAMTVAMWTHIVLGAVIAALAIWRGWSVHYGHPKPAA